MKDSLKNLQNEYKKINKKSQFTHSIIQNNYDNLCMKFFADKYNTLVAQQMAQESVCLALESEDIFVDWLNKE